MRSEAGFTLLELTIAMAVVTVIAAAVASSFGMGLQVWERTQQAADKNQESAALMQIFSNDMRSAWVSENGKIGTFVLTATDKQSKGEPSFSFATLVSDREDGRLAQLMQVSYRFDAEEGALYRSMGPVPTEAEQSSGQTATVVQITQPAEEEALVDHVSSFAVRCWDGEQWSSEWPLPAGTTVATTKNADGTTTTAEPPKLPQMVELTVVLTPEQGAERTLQTQIPIEMARP